MATRLFDFSDNDAATEMDRPCSWRQSSQDEFDQRGLAGTVRSDQYHSLVELNCQVQWAEHEAPAIDNRLLARRYDVVAPGRGGDCELRLPLFVWVVNHVESVDGLLGPRCLAGQLFGLVHPEVFDVLVVLA